MFHLKVCWIVKLESVFLNFVLDVNEVKLSNELLRVELLDVLAEV